MKTYLYKIFVGILVACYLSSIVLSGVVFATPTQVHNQQAPLSKHEPKRGVNPETGKLSFIGDGDPINVPGLSDVKGMPSEERAGAMANIYGKEFGLQNPTQDLKLLKSEKDSNGKDITRFQQIYKGVPVIAGETIVNTNANGELLSISGEVSSDLNLDTSPVIKAQEASKTALAEIANLYKVNENELKITDPQLWIFDESLLTSSTRPIELVWRMEVTPPRSVAQSIRELVLVNAQTGVVSWHINQVDTDYPVRNTGSQLSNGSAQTQPAQQFLCTGTPLSGSAYFDMAIDEAHGRIFGSDANDTKLDIFTYSGNNPPTFLMTLCLGYHPRGLDISPDGNELAVTLYDGGKIAFYDLTLSNDQLAGQVPQYITPNVDTLYPNKPYDLIYGRLGRLYAVGGPSSGGIDYIHVIDTSSTPRTEISRSTYVIRSGPRLAMSADKNTLFVLEPSGSPYKLYRFDATTDTVTYQFEDPHGPIQGTTIATITDPAKIFTSSGQVWSTIGYGPRNVFSQMGKFTDGGSEIEYVKARDLIAVSNGSQVSLIETQDFQVVARFPVTGTAGVAKALSDGSALLISTTSGLQRVSLEPFPAPLPISCATGLPKVPYYDMVIDDVHQKIFASDRSGLKVDVFSYANPSKDPIFLESVCTAGRQPVGLDISPDGNQVAVALLDGYKLGFIDTSTSQITFVPFFNSATGYASPSDLLYGRSGRLYIGAHDSDLAPNGYIYLMDLTNKNLLTRSSARHYSSSNLSHIAISADKLKIFYAQTGVSSQRIFRLDVSTDQLGNYEVSGSPGFANTATLLVLPDNSKVFTSWGEAWTYDLQTQLGSLLSAGSEIEYIGQHNVVAISGSSSQVSFFSTNTYASLGNYAVTGTAGVTRALSDGSVLYISTSNGLMKFTLTGFPLPTATPTASTTPSPTRTPTATNSSTFTPLPSFTPSITLTPGPGPSRTPGPTATAGPSPTQVPSSSTGNRTTYTASNGGTIPGTFLCDQNQSVCTNGVDPDADEAHQYAADTFMFYNIHHHRNSINDAGNTIVSTVHYGVNYQNAFWTGSQMVYGDGMAADDVVGHELTHGVTQYTSGLIYYSQSGAINESFSDVWGEFIDQTNNSGNDSLTFKWLLGEDTPLGVIRSMRNPPAYGNPDKMSSPYYYVGSYDNGGVHINSGVNNKAAYLMVDGDTFNGRTIMGIGLNKTAAIYYEAQAHLLTAGANYNDLYYALNQACQNLIGGPDGITQNDCIQVQLATEAVEMIPAPLPTPTPTLTLTPTFTPSNTATATLTFTPTYTPTPTIVTLILQPDAATGMDTYIYSSSKSSNFGTAVSMGVGEDNNANNRIARSLIKFDLSSIPANATINSATLSLWTNADLSSNNRTVRVYRLKIPFNETQATWNVASAGVSWQAVGASGTNDRESADIGSVTVLNNEALSVEKQIVLTPSKIQEMTNGAFANRGFILVADTESNDRFNYKTSDSSTSSQRPKLVVQYTVPPNTSTPSATPISTHTLTPTATFTRTSTPSNTPTSTISPTTTSTRTATMTATSTATTTPSLFRPYVYAPVGSGRAVAIGDFNSDGLQDVAMTDSEATTSQLFVFLQQTDGSLGTPIIYGAGYQPFSLAVGDLNHDGRADLVATNMPSNEISVFLQQSNGTFAPRVTYSTISGRLAVAVGDLNGDGWDDVAVSGNDLGVFLQNAAGTLNPMVSYSSPGSATNIGDIAIEDVNNDGKKDVIKQHGSPSFLVYLQKENGTLASALSYSLQNCSPYCGIGSLTTGDVTGDGLADIIITTAANRPNAKIAVFKQAQDGSLQQSALYDSYDIPVPVVVSDVNQDALADFLVGNSSWNQISLFSQRTDGTLNPYILYLVPYSDYGPFAMAVGDINHDGLPDVTVADANKGLVVLYHSESSLPNPPTPTRVPVNTATNTATLVPTVTKTFTPTQPTSTPTFITFTPSPLPTFTATKTLLPTATATAQLPTATAASSSLTFIANADSYVNQASATANYGTNAQLWMDGDTGANYQSYLRFSVSGISGTVKSAILRVYSTSSTVDGPAVYATTNNWTETGITWNTQPALTSSMLDDKGAIATGVWIDYSVTAVITGDGTYSFVFVPTSTDSVSFSSREGTQPPQLILTIAP